MNTTEGYIYRKGMSPETRTVISTKNKIYAKPAKQDNFLQIGVVASFEPSDSRSVEAIKGIGYGDQIAELIPNSSEPISISVNRSALYLSLLMQTFGYNAGVDGLVRALKHHRWPFDIKQEIVFSEIASQDVRGAVGAVTSTEGSNMKALITLYEACWMTSYNWSYSSDTSLVQEGCEIQCSDIMDMKSNYETHIQPGVDTGNNPFVSGQGGSQRFRV